MNTFLVMLSLILNILALFAIILLFLRQNRLTLIEKRQESMIKEMEEVISTYLVEMKEENENFIKRMKNDYIIRELHKQNEVVEDKSPLGNVTLEKEQPQIKISKGSTYQAVQAYKQYKKAKDPVEEFLKDTSNISEENEIEKNQDKEKLKPADVNTKHEISTYDQVLQLHKQGKTVEEIAKSLNLGKTETILILKFRQKDDSLT